NRVRCPFYVNHGFIAMPRPLMERLQQVHVSYCRQVSKLLRGSYFSVQIALTLSIAALGLRVMALPMRYNFPNDPVADRLYPDELQNVTCLHYLRTRQFDRHKIFQDQEGYAGFVENS